jgi:hypothetical protein
MSDTEDTIKWQPLPSIKSEKIDELFKNLYGVDRKTSIISCTCVSCSTTGITENAFRDDTSLREFHISGLCQMCQDKIFGFE